MIQNIDTDVIDTTSQNDSFKPNALLKYTLLVGMLISAVSVVLDIAVKFYFSYMVGLHYLTTISSLSVFILNIYLFQYFKFNNLKLLRTIVLSILIFYPLQWVVTMILAQKVGPAELSQFFEYINIISTCLYGGMALLAFSDRASIAKGIRSLRLAFVLFLLSSLVKIFLQFAEVSGISSPLYLQSADDRFMSLSLIVVFMALLYVPLTFSYVFYAVFVLRSSR